MFRTLKIIINFLWEYTKIENEDQFSHLLKVPKVLDMFDGDSRTE